MELAVQGYQTVVKGFFEVGINLARIGMGPNQELKYAVNQTRSSVHELNQFMVCVPSNPVERDCNLFKQGLQKTQEPLFWDVFCSPFKLY